MCPTSRMFEAARKVRSTHGLEMVDDQEEEHKKRVVSCLCCECVATDTPGGDHTSPEREKQRA